MPVLQLDDQQFPLKTGATKVGSGAGADVVVPGYSAIGVEAVIDGGATPTIRRAEESAHVRVNGVLLGAEPTPLMHGDKIEIAGLELRYADDAKGGATQFVSASEIAAMAGTKRSGAARATAASGGRVVSLMDGKEYAVPGAGLVFGRDAACDVVVAQNDVSRKHAEIVPGEQGYIVRDTSANGLYVNGERVQGSHKLARADVIRIGTEEFRFYADVLAAAPTPPVGVPVIPPVAAPPAPLPVAPPMAAAPTPLPDPEPIPAPEEAETMPLVLADLVSMELVPEVVPPPRPTPATPAAPSAPVATPSAPAAAAPREDSRPVLAVLEAMNEGPGKGTKYELRSALGHVGRGAHNDVRLSDESVSETHAKLQKREDGWYVVDMDSTNGTYVGGARISGERKLEGSPDLRFGGLKFRFTAVGAGSAAELEAKGTRAIAAIGRPSSVSAPVQTTAKTPQATAKTPQPQPPQPAPVAKQEKGGGGLPGWIWIIVALAIIGAAVYFVMKGRGA